MSQNTPYITLLQVLESFANSHLQVRRFKSDFLEQLGNFGTATEEYPVLYVVPENANFFNELHTDLTSFTLRVYCLDVIQKDRANVNPILNNTSQILNDLHKWLKNAKIPGIDIASVSTLFPLNNYLLDYVAGWFMTVTFEVESYSYCEIPFSTPPVVPQNVMDIVYNPFQGPTGPTGPTGSPNSLFVQTGTSVPVTNTNVETTVLNGGLGTLSVPANGFNIGDSFQAKLAGFISTQNNHTLEIKIKSGSTVLATTGVLTLPNITSKSWELEANFTVRTIGAPGIAEIVTTGFYLYNKNANNALEGGDFTTINNTTFDTTVSNTLDITATWGQTDPIDSISTETFLLSKTY